MRRKLKTTLKKPSKGAKKHLKVFADISELHSINSGSIELKAEESVDSTPKAPKRLAKAYMKMSVALQKSNSTKEAALPSIATDRLKSQKSMSSTFDKLES